MTEALPTDGDRCPTCGQQVERGWYGDDLTNGYFPVAERAARCNLAEVERLRAREAALVALLDRTWPFLAGYQCDSMQEGDKLTALEAEIEKALAADPSAPATTEEGP